MKKLDVYIIRELFVPFFIGTFAVVFMFQANEIIAIGKAMNLDKVPILALFQYILYKTPQFLSLTLPVGMALAAGLAMTRLARESELTAMRAAGYKILRVVAPVAVFGMLVSVANYWVVEKVMPTSSRKARELEVEAGIVGFTNTFKSNSFQELGKFAASFGTVQKIGKDKLQISDALLVERSEPGVVTLTSAKKAYYDNGVWTLKNAYYFRLKDLDLDVAKPLGDMTINDMIKVDQMFQTPLSEEMSTGELRDNIISGRKLGQNVKDLEVQWHTKYSVPAACFIFSVVSPVFAVFFARSGGFTGVLVSLIVVMLYYNAYVISSQILGKVDAVPAWVAGWLPDIIFGLLGLWALRKLE